VLLTFNDIVSLLNELEEKNKENLVLVKLNNNKSNLRDAFDQTIKYYQDETKALLNLSQLAAKDTILTEYYQNIISCVHDCVNWHKATKRYATKDKKAVVTFSMPSSNNIEEKPHREPSELGPTLHH
jgi:hypothetical protein